MTESFILAPRYRLDDESIWLEGIDPSRHYWILVNGEPQIQANIAGVMVSSVEELKDIVKRFRCLQPQEKMTIERIAGSCTIHCLGTNCYGIEGEVNGAIAWHLFDRETIEMLLRTSHPDWIPSPQDLELGRRLLSRTFQQPAYA